MRCFWYLLSFCHAALAGNLYSPTSYAFPASTLVSPQPISSLHYTSPLRTSTGYGPLGSARVGNIAAPFYAPAPITAATAPAVYSAPIYSAPVVARYPVTTAYAAPVAPVLGRIAAPVVQKYAAVSTIADVPITRYEAQPGFIQKYVDVAHPKLATTKIQIRRPAIQKQFYDIEERIVVRPVASAVVELDQPISKSQAGPTLVSPALPAAPGIISAAPIHVPQLPPVPTYGPPQPLPPPSAPENPQSPPPSAPENPQFPSPSVPENPQFPSPSAPENPQFPSPSAPEGPQFPFPTAPQNPQFPPPSAPQSPQLPVTSATDSGQESDDSDSITVENEEVRARSSMQQQIQIQQRSQTRQQSQPMPPAAERNQQQNEEPQSEQQPEQPEARSSSLPSGPQQTEARFLTRSQIYSNTFNNFPTQSRSVEDIIPSSRSQLTEEQSQSNQQRLIELLTGRGGIAEVRSGVSIDAASEIGQIRGRVLSVTPAPSTSGPADERVSTRRVVVSRPIQTLQEVDVVQPFTKLQRLSVQHPAILKTPRVDIARVKTIAPVPITSYGAYTPYTYVH